MIFIFSMPEKLGPQTQELKLKIKSFKGAHARLKFTNIVSICTFISIAILTSVRLKY